ncbi:MAG: FtsX-like permease family protein [Bacteroidales bacterium]
MILRFPLYIAKRYLISKKRRNVINIITSISVIGVGVGTMALIVVMSIFNGFDDLLQSLYHSFDPDLRITAAEGKSFSPDSNTLSILESQPDILEFSQVIEENALLKYDDQQFIARLKGVDANYINVSGVDTMVTSGEFKLYEDGVPLAVAGQGVAYKLSLGINRHTPVKCFVPKRDAHFTGSFMDASNAINQKNVYVAGYFSIQQDFDNQYVIVPIAFARDIFGYDNELSAIEVKLKPDADDQQVKSDLQASLGNTFLIQDRYEQHALFYKIMSSEKWAVFLILTFILLIASFNVIGSLTMLILDKKEDIYILRSLGADNKTISRIFLIEGWLITAVGAVFGLLAGTALSWAQMEFGLIQLGGSGSFIIDAYPVILKGTDFVVVFFTVLLIGFLASWYPVRYITGKYL